MNATQPPRGWPGVGAQLAGRLARLDLRGPRDVLLHLPLRYEDETRLTPIARLRPGFPAQVEGEVLGSEVVLRPRRQLVARIADDSGTLVARWLNFYPSQQKPLAPGGRVRLFGEARGGFFGLEMVHPRLRAVAPGEALPDALTPVYPTTAGVGQITLRKLVAQALQEFIDAGMLSLPYEDAFRRVMLRAPPDTFGVEDITGLPWIEIDFPSDVDRARTIVLPELRRLGA